MSRPLSPILADLSERQALQNQLLYLTKYCDVATSIIGEETIRDVLEMVTPSDSFLKYPSHF